jgi:hypothetical protein
LASLEGDEVRAALVQLGAQGVDPALGVEQQPPDSRHIGVGGVDARLPELGGEYLQCLDSILIEVGEVAGERAYLIRGDREAVGDLDVIQFSVNLVKRYHPASRRVGAEFGRCLPEVGGCAGIRDRRPGFLAGPASASGGDDRCEQKERYLNPEVQASIRQLSEVIRGKANQRP